MDRILIKDLLARCIIGVNEDERHEKQDVIINVALSTDLSKASNSDRFDDTVDYREIEQRILEQVDVSRFYLVEALAERIAQICLDNPAVREAWVSVEKPSASRSARSVGVEITRRQPK